MSPLRLGVPLCLSLLGHAGFFIYMATLARPEVVPSASGPLQLTLEAARNRAVSGDGAAADAVVRSKSSRPAAARSLQAASATIGEVGSSHGGARAEQMPPRPASSDRPTAAVPESQAAAPNAIDGADLLEESGIESGRADGGASGSADPAGDRESTGVLTRLRSVIRAHFYYPELARRQGWEGRVTLGVRVEADGRLTGIRVIESSGYPVLDAAALDCLRRAGRLVDGVPALKAALDVTLPVQYLLVDSSA
jgi:TonB family protein